MQAAPAVIIRRRDCRLRVEVTVERDGATEKKTKQKTKQEKKKTRLGHSWGDFWSERERGKKKGRQCQQCWTRNQEGKAKNVDEERPKATFGAIMEKQLCLKLGVGISLRKS